MRFAFVGLAALSLSAIQAQADTTVDDIVQQFPSACDAEHVSFQGIDDYVEEPMQGTLTLANEAIYELQFTPNACNSHGHLQSTPRLSQSGGNGQRSKI